MVVAGVAAELIRRVMGSGALAATAENTSQLKRRIVPTFMEATKIEQLTEKAKESAARHLRELVVEESRKANAQTGTTVSIHPVTLPIDDSFVVDLDKKVLDLLGRQEKSAGKAGFSTAEYYGTWKKGLFEAARFDSFTGEYRLAALLDLDPNVVWWEADLRPRRRASGLYPAQLIRSRLCCLRQGRHPLDC